MKAATEDAADARRMYLRERGLGQFLEKEMFKSSR